MSFEAFEALFNERQGNVTHYLSELNKQHDQWQEQQVRGEL